MIMASTLDHMAARGDADLFERFVACAEQAGIENAAQWVQANMPKLVSLEVQDGQTVTDVYTYARNVRDEALAAVPERPGINLGAVTDTHLLSAITTLQGGNA